ncbi:MAG: hypothetical protein QM719_12685 [Thermomonas sp.]
MSPEDFRDALERRTDQDLVELCLYGDLIPFVFEEDEQAWDRFRRSVGERLGTDAAQIAVIGSGRFGFSLKPGANLRSFVDTSDIDLIIVDAVKFDELWDRLLTGVYPRPPVNVNGWLRECQKELFTGWLTPVEIRPDRRIHGKKVDPLLQLTHAWFETLKVSSGLVAKAHEKINARLYRTWRQAELYHAHSIAALRQSISEQN